MIPYEDLVVALQGWRAKQGLPVTPGLVMPTASPGSGRTSAPVAAQPEPEPLAYEAADESLEVDEALVEEHDHEAGYGAVEAHTEDATSIGRPPARGDYEENATEVASESGQLRNQREDW